MMRRLVASAVAALLVAAPARAQAPAAGPPNVVLVIGDDQAWTDYGFMGHPHIRTPHIDRLAAEGAAFVNGYTPTPLCRPSLATMITGLYPHQHGITGNDPPPDVDRANMVDFIARVPTLPRTLGQLGYRSLQTGKWWEGHFATGGFTHGMTINGKGGRHGDLGLEIGRQGLQPVRDFLANRGDAPFFLWYAPFLPHTPHNPPERLLAYYRGLGLPEALAKYYAMCEWFDETVGELLALIDASGQRDNTLVLFAADNGWIQPVAPIAGWEHPFAPRSKRSPYEGGVRTPILARWPGRIAPGRREVLASTIDLAPTVLRAAGLPVPAELPGEDLTMLAARAHRDAVFGEAFAHDVADLRRPAASLLFRWVREGDYKLIQSAAGARELYDLARDPHEQRDLAATRAELADRLIARLDGWWDPRRAQPLD